MEFARWHAHSLNITYKIYLQIIEHRLTFFCKTVQLCGKVLKTDVERCDKDRIFLLCFAMSLLIGRVTVCELLVFFLVSSKRKRNEISVKQSPYDHGTIVERID